jgi:NAD(P)-dependent dehydrogenase (short-subunit alcohol dehydrogenase family)
MSQRVAVVTGSNKGIGLAIVKGLAPIFDGIVYLTGNSLFFDRTKNNHIKS